MECCRICLTTNQLSNIFDTEELASNITAIASVDICENDGLPQYICLLCKHELDISINFKDKCETTFEILKQQHTKEVEIKENIIVNLLSGHHALSDQLQQTRKTVLNALKNSIENGAQNITQGINDNNSTKEIFNDKTCDESNFDQDQYIEDYESEDDQTQMITSPSAQATLLNDADDQMTDTTENELDISDSLLGNQDIMCQKCNFCFTNESCLYDHLKRIHSKTMGQCQICLSYFPTSQFLKGHLSLKHDISEEESSFKRCKFCMKTYERQTELTSHLCLHPYQREFWCELCELNFKVESDLEDHIKQVHSQIEFTYEKCNKETDTVFENRLENPKDPTANLIDDGNKIELMCSECNNCFSSNEEWDKHIDQCNKKEKVPSFDENSYVCPLCEKCFKTDNMLSIHIRKHTGEKLYKCNTCCKSFLNSTLLTRHEKLHKKTKPHVCAICQTSFYKKNSLESHLLLHDNLIKCTKKETYISCDSEED